MEEKAPNVVQMPKRKPNVLHAPEGQCEFCDKRRAYYRKAVAKCRPVKRRA